jgi:hypothetical protein
MTLWRNARVVLKKILNLNFKYQHKLTKYLVKFVKFVKFKVLLLNELSLENILLKSRILPDKAYIVFFIEKGLIYLNGSNCYNRNLSLFIGDWIQMIVNLKYYITYK